MVAGTIPTIGRPGSTLVRLTMSTSTSASLRATSDFSGKPLGTIITEGVCLLIATRGAGAPRRGVRRLPRGRKPAHLCRDQDVPIVILEDDAIPA